MQETTSGQGKLIFTGIAVGTTIALAALSGYVRREIARRGYPSWESCQCDFKQQYSFYQVWFSRHEQRGETIITEERGTYLSNPAQWLRRLLHHGSQVIAVFNPRHRHVERITLSPQEAYQFAVLLRTASASEELTEEEAQAGGQIVWRREVLHEPRYLFDTYTRRLYPVHIAQERTDAAQPLPALWDPITNLPLPYEGTLLETPDGTRIDYIGWTPSQVSYCTARLQTKDSRVSVLPQD